MMDIQQKWRSYFTSRCRNELDDLVAAYPDQRSLSVDVLDMYEFDDEFVQTLFDRPIDSISQGADAVRDISDIAGPIHIRIENNPQQRPVSDLHAAQAHELITVGGFVKSVGPVEATVIAASYECPSCGRTVRQPEPKIDLDPPTECEICGSTREFGFRASDSYFVNLQEITLGRTANARNEGPRNRLTAYLTDDLVGTVSENQCYCLTGIIRVYQTDVSNQFQLYLDVNSVSDESQRPKAVPDDLTAALESHWQATVQ